MTSKKTLYIAFSEGERAPEELEVSPSFKYLTIGSDPDTDIPASMPGFAGKFRLIKRSLTGGITVSFPASVDVTVTIGSTTLSGKALFDFGLLGKRKGLYLYYLPAYVPCRLTFGDLSLHIGYKETPVKVKRREIIDSSIKKHLVPKEDLAFLAILVICLISGFSFTAFLSTVKINKKEGVEVIRAIPTRFAKLVLEPPKKVVAKGFGKEIATAGGGGKGEPKAEEAAPKETRETKKATKGEAPSRAADTGTVSPGPAIIGSAGGAPGTGGGSGGGVKSKGLLGVIMAKSKPPDFLAQDILQDADEPVRGGGPGGGRGGSEQAAGDVLSDIVTARGGGGGEGGFGSGGPGGGGSGGGIGGGTGTGIGTGVGPGVSRGGTGGKRKETAEIIKEKKDVIGAEIEKAKPQQTDAAILASLRKRDEAEIYKTIMSYIGGLKYLYNNALRKDATLKGKISVKIVVGQDGKVKEASKTSSTLNNQELEDAMISRIQKWKFPELQGGEDFPITYTFDFSPVG